MKHVTLSSLITTIYDFIFRACSKEVEWRKYHKLTRSQIDLVTQKGAGALEDSGWFKCDRWIVEDLMGKMTINEATHALEIGCGSGALSQMLHQIAGCKITLLDSSEDALELAQLLMNEKSIPSEIVQGDAFKLPFKANTFDLVHSTGLIEHFDDELIKVQLREVRRVLKPEGKLYVSVPNFFSPYLLFLWLLGGKHTERYMTNAHLRKLLKASGFTINRTGKTSFVVPKIMQSKLLVFVEKTLGRAFFGFLNYAVATHESEISDRNR